MNRGQLRTTLRGWLQDSVAKQMDAARLNEFINLGLREAQKILVAVDPELLKCQYRRHLTVPATGRDKLVPWPVGTWAVFEVRASTDGGINYGVPLDRITLYQARQGRAGFVPYDASHFMLAPSPTSAYTWGLSVTVMPTAVFALDTDELPVRFVAHETLILKQAQKFAMWDAGEPTDKIEAEISTIEQRVPRFFLTATQPQFVVPVGYDGYELS